MTIGIAYPSIYVTDLRSFFVLLITIFGDHKFEISVVGQGTLKQKVVNIIYIKYVHMYMLKALQRFI